MVLIELKKTFEKRRANLISMLQNDAAIDLGVQHQIYGAIKEIEVFLRTLDHLKELDQQAMRLELRNDQDPRMVEKINEKLKTILKSEHP